MTILMLEGFWGSSEILERLQKVTGKPCHGLQPTHPTQTVDLSKRIQLKITHLIPATKKTLYGDLLKLPCLNNKSAKAGSSCTPIKAPFEEG